jgi:uncharacterized protein DUF4136
MPRTAAGPEIVPAFATVARRTYNTESSMRIATMVMLVSLILPAARAAAQDVTYDYDKSADFSRIKTYAWVAGTPVTDELNHKRIVAAVDSQLGLRGLRQVEAGGTPDVVVAYHARFTRDLEISTSGWGGYRLAASRSGTARVQEVTVGALTVEMLEARTRSVVWRASATKDVNRDASPEKRDKNINKAAEKLFKHYPPKA